MNDYIAKPIEPQSMFKTLLKWVNHKHMICPKSNDVTKENSRNKDNIFIPGLNTKLGLRHMLGNQKLYVDILRKFAYGQKDSISKIRVAVNNNDYDLAERIAHTLKSVAGSIGAEDIQKSAFLIEKSIRVRAPDSEIISQSEKANALIKEMIENLKNIISVESKTFKRKTVSNENLIKMLIDLKPCVKKSRPKDCQKILEQYENVKWPDKFQAEATLMILDIKKYRYKEALDLLELLLSKLKEGV
jgi:HPt (histidine-containing phosphotransfer) domain-containing protein